MALRLYNTLTRSKDAFQPLDAKNVRMYVCGPTVYDYAHIGNGRPVIVFDVLFRLLRHIYGPQHVTYARNITDVDDKIIERARQEHPGLPLNAAIAEVTARTTQQFHADIAALGVLPPTVEPTCTGHIPEMVAMIEVLIGKGAAYAAEGHVLLDTQKIASYGELSGRSMDDMIAGARVEVAPYKRHPADSVLWKPSSDEQPGWPSPWGRGRPGWHIECSAMAEKHLGPVFDIHGGGIDLVFPHHENEVAQSRCAHGTAVMANVWMHNGFLQVEGEKMSKSLGNFVTIRDVLTGWKGPIWPGSVVRLAMLSSHYRQPIDWTFERLIEARRELRFWLMSIANDDELNEEFIVRKSGWEPTAEFAEALEDDLNTPAALAVLRSYASATGKVATKARRDLAANLGFLGFLTRSAVLPLAHGMSGVGLPRAIVMAAFSLADDFRLHLANGNEELASKVQSKLRALGVEIVENERAVTLTYIGTESGATIDDLIAARLEARRRKDFKESDRIRDELAAMGIQLKDAKNKTTGELETTWEVKR